MFDGQKINDTIIAFDILPMSSTSRQGGVLLAASASFSSGETKEWPQISRNKLLNTIKKINAKYLGTDSPTEILFNGESIASFCSLLPTQCIFVHINLTKTGRTLPLKNLLQQYQITSSMRKTSPILTARAIVKLIQFGVGMKLDPFESETIIEIGKPRSSSKGGWSQSRYKRQGEEIVARSAKVIRSMLKKSNLPFDEIIRNTKYGAKLSRFHIFSAKSIIEKRIKTISLYPAKIKIWSPIKHVVTHSPLINSENEHRAQFYNHIQRLFIGIDPGMTTGVAILDLLGNVVSIFSRKNLSKGKLVSVISDYGIPVVICSDVYPVPTFVSKLGSTYNAEVFYPSSQLSQDEKRQLASSAKIQRRLDSHERDALSAVIYSFKKFKLHFEKLGKRDLSHKELDLAKGLVIRGLSVKDSINAVRMLRNNNVETVKVEITKDIATNENIGRLYNLLHEMAISEETITNLRAHTGRLEAKLNQHDIRLKQTAWKLSQMNNELIRELLSSELIEEKDLEIKMLKNTLSNIKEENKNLRDNKLAFEKLLWLTLENDCFPVKILPVFSHDAIYKLKKEKNLSKDDIVLILDPTGGGPQTALNLISSELKMIFIERYDLSKEIMQIFDQSKTPVIRSEPYDIRRFGFLAVINSHNFYKAMENYHIQLEKRNNQVNKFRINLEIENYRFKRDQEFTKSMKNYDNYEPNEMDN